MATFWTNKSYEEIKERVFAALSRNVNYHVQNVFGVPASQLDEKVFYKNASFLKYAPFLSTLMENPNHIGCHTLELSEPFFEGTQEIERELINICAVDILKGEAGQHDGYVASGGTEANIQAIWIYRNYFIQELGASPGEICIVCSEDSHYSIDKAANILSLDIAKVPVTESGREVTSDAAGTVVRGQADAGKKFFIVILNMMTTMFGSVDDVDVYLESLRDFGGQYRVHVDAAFGGFYYPFTGGDISLDFSNPAISSVALDAHKMLQAPYGTGIFLIRKGLMQYAVTKEAKYVEGQDYTLIGSRSGANAVAVWMILVRNGPHGWHDKIALLQERALWLCAQLDDIGASYYRHPNSNIVTVRSGSISTDLADENWLVPDNHEDPAWYKIVVMEHVTIDKLAPFVEQMKGDR